MKETLSIHSADFEIRRSPRRKKVAVGFDPDSGINYIAAPAKLSCTNIERILQPHIEDLIRRIDSGRKKHLPPHKYEDGEIFCCKGTEYPLKWTGSSALVPLRLENGVFYISSDRIGKEKETFEAWYKKTLYETIRIILPQWTRKIMVNPNTVNIKNVKSVWGSCSSKGNVTFSTRLALVSEDLVEYVVAHELCHLKHMDHSPLFWGELTKHMGDCKERRKRLKEEQYRCKWW